MGKIIKHEFLKIFTSKLFLYTLMVFILANIVLLIYTQNIAKKDEIPYSAYKILNEEIKDLSRINRQRI